MILGVWLQVPLAALHLKSGGRNCLWKTCDWELTRKPVKVSSTVFRVSFLVNNSDIPFVFSFSSQPILLPFKALLPSCPAALDPVQGSDRHPWGTFCLCHCARYAVMSVPSGLWTLRALGRGQTGPEDGRGLTGDRVTFWAHSFMRNIY